MFWIKCIQSNIFAAKFRALINNKTLSSESPLLSLCPFLDQNGILRVSGRLRNTLMPYSIRHSIFFTSHPLVKLIVQPLHKQALHAGLQLTLSMLRGEFWILHVRSIVKAIIHRYVVCSYEQQACCSHNKLPHFLNSWEICPRHAWQLPSALFAVGSTTPGRCMCEHLPIEALYSERHTSRYLCLATRAIYLELVADYSTSFFLNVFSRFCSRWELSYSTYSDNGITFIGTDRELRNIYRAAFRDLGFQNTTISDNISWNFILTSSPQRDFGGVFGVLNMTCAAVWKVTLTFEEFTTLLCRIEACLNSRQIAPHRHIMSLSYRVICWLGPP